MSSRLPATGPHGGDGLRVARSLGIDPHQMVDLSASLNPHAPDTATVVAAVLDRDPAMLSRYPDPTAATQDLATAIGVDPDRLILTNGGAEAIALVAWTMGSGHIVEPEFSLYRRHLDTLDTAAPRWRSNPSNPLGHLADADEQAGVWDEAFYPIATGHWTRGDENAWRIGSLTKLWNCPGLRLGYAIGPTVAAVSRLRTHQPQWAVNGLAAAVTPELLAVTDLAGWHLALTQLRSDFVTGLVGLGYEVQSTSANWVLVHRRNLRADLAPFGVVVRDCASFGLATVHRVAVPSPQELDRVLTAFAQLGDAP